MKSYDVHIWKQVVKSTTITVKAENEQDAKELAWGVVWDSPKSVYWNEKTSDSGSSVHENKCF